MLLNGNDGNCEDDGIEKVVLWLSLAAVAIAIIFVILGIVFVEVKLRLRFRREDRNFTKIAQNISRASQH